MILFNPTKMGGLSIGEFITAKDYYEACCTAEYVLDNCEPKPTEKEALRIGYLVREVMYKWDEYNGDAEVRAIDIILQKPHLWKEAN